MIDTHTHLYLPEFDVDGGGEAAVDRALDAGVRFMVFPNVDRSSVQPMKALHALRPDCTAMAMGLHPTEVKENWADELQYILSELDSNPNEYKAIGEIGIDLYWDKTFEQEQMRVLDRQLAEAEARSLPVILHCREGLDRTLEVLAGYPGVRAVFHSFGGSVADVERICTLGDYYFGINGIVTFKNSTLRTVLPAISPDRILTETDSPYLAPVPMRGKRNESAFIKNILDAIAPAIGLDFAEACELTCANARRFFNLDQLTYSNHTKTT